MTAPVIVVPQAPAVVVPAPGLAVVATGARGPQGVAAGDVPSTLVDPFTGWTFLAAGIPVDWGTGAIRRMRWHRTGRTIDMRLQVQVGTGHNLNAHVDDPIVIGDAHLPVPGRDLLPANLPDPGAFGVVIGNNGSGQESSKGIGSVYLTISAGVHLIGAFQIDAFHVTPEPTFALLSQGSPLTLITGSTIVLHAIYEAAEEAP